MTVWLQVTWDIMMKNNSHLYKNVFICQSGLESEMQRSDGDVNLTDWGKRDGSSWLKTVWNRKPTYRSEALIYADAHGEEISMYGKALLLLLLLPRSRSAGLRLSLKSGCCEIIPEPCQRSKCSAEAAFYSDTIKKKRGGFEDERWLHILHVHEVCTYIKPTVFYYVFLSGNNQTNCTTLLLWMLFHTWNQLPPSKTRNASFFILDVWAQPCLPPRLWACTARPWNKTMEHLSGHLDVINNC